MTAIQEVQPPANTQFPTWHQQTVGDLIDQASDEASPAPTFFEEYADDETRKEYGSADIPLASLSRDRVIGVYGVRKVALRGSVTLNKAFRQVVLKSKGDKPLILKGTLCVHVGHVAHVG